MLVASREEIEAGADVSTVLFHTRASREASRAFLAWFRAREGRATKTEVAEFADALDRGGMAPARLSRSNFYRTVLKAFVRAGLITLIPEFDREARKVRQVYKAVTQPIAKRRPGGPSLVLNAHLLAEMWNAYFDSES